MAAVRMTGEAELQRNIRDCMSQGKHGKAAIRKGLRAGAKVVAKKIKANSPVKSGAMQRSVKVRAMKRSRKRIGVRVEVKEYYVGFVDLGTKKLKATKFGEKAVEEVGKGALRQTNEGIIAELERRAAIK